jgi:hypothetical protein
MPEIEYNGEVHHFPDDFTDDDIADALAQLDLQTFESPTGAGTAIPLAAATGRAVPGMMQGAARFAANHPAATQKVIGAGISAGAGGVGAAVGGVPGAVVGASIRGVTPAQTVIRETAGRMAGETPQVAQNAARTLGIQNYAKELTGARIPAADIINKPNAANAIEGYANSLEKGILRLYGPDGQVVSGPNKVLERAPAVRGGTIAKIAAPVAKVLGPLSAMTGITDFAQTVEPGRTDIGIAGIGKSQPDLPPEDVATLDAANKAAMTARLQSQDQQRADLIQQILQSLGLR